MKVPTQPVPSTYHNAEHSSKVMNSPYSKTPPITSPSQTPPDTPPSQNLSNLTPPPQPPTMIIAYSQTPPITYSQKPPINSSSQMPSITSPSQNLPNLTPSLSNPSAMIIPSLTSFSPSASLTNQNTNSSSPIPPPRPTHLPTSEDPPLLPYPTSPSAPGDPPSPPSPSDLNNNNLINISFLNTRSARNKVNHIRDLIIEHRLHLLGMVETWIRDTDTSVIASFLPDTHVFHHFPRPEGRGGGVGIALSKNFQNIKSFNRFNDQFECMELHASYLKTKMVFSIVYRPPNGNTSKFISEFEKHVFSIEKSEKNVIYLGDFNIWMDDVNNIEAIRMNTLLKNYSLKNHISSPTHISGHTLDLVISHKNLELVKNVRVDQEALISDHKSIYFNINISMKYKVYKTIHFRKKKS